MSGWDDPTGWPYYAVGICDRCNRQFPLHELIEDGNLPGLRVCREDWDELDPYRLASATDREHHAALRASRCLGRRHFLHSRMRAARLHRERGRPVLLHHRKRRVRHFGRRSFNHNFELGVALAVSVSTLPECNELLIAEPWAS